MRNKKNLEPAHTFESVWAALQETRAYIDETVRLMRESAQRAKEEADQRAKEFDQRAKEAEQRAKEEADKRAKEETQRAKEEAQRAKENDRMIKEMNRQLGGISNSNGEMAEAYFYNSFRRDKTFAKEKFDSIKRNLHYNNGEKEAEFDIILFNGKSAALIEVKYTAKPDNISVRRIISRVAVFKLLYPEFKNYNIYLGVAAMSFRKGMEQRLHNAGIATVRQVGKKMVVYDQEVKVF
jgi:hypothetical protein